MHFLKVLLLGFVLLHCSTPSMGQCSTCYVDDGLSGCTYTISGAVNNPTYTLNSSSDKLCIESGAVVTGNWKITVNDPAATIVNNGTINVNPVNFKQGIFINNGTVNFKNLVMDNGSITNYGLLTVTNNVNINSDDVDICNQDSINIGKSLNAKGEIRNEGSLTVGNSFTQNSGTYCTENVGLVYTSNLTINSTVKGPNSGDGCVVFNITGTSTINYADSLIGAVDFCDSSPPGSSPFVDNHPGSLDSNITYCSCISTLDLEIGSLNIWQDQHDAIFSSTLFIYPSSYIFILEGSSDGTLFTQVSSQGIHIAYPQVLQWNETISLQQLEPHSYLRLRIVQEDGNSSFSTMIRNDIGVKRAKLRWHYDPLDQYLHLDGLPPEATQVEILNLKGQVLMLSSQPPSHGQLDMFIPQEMKGVFFLLIILGDQVISHKLLLP
ncbi:MAG: hypothetical protein AAFY71_12860 [Bacteroidota bacterium]